jgi:hypothetical protein
MPPAREPDDTPAYAIRALATGTVPLSLSGADFMLGLRAELDVYRVSAQFSWDRSGTTPFTLTETSQWNALLGWSFVANKWARVRLLGGVSGASNTTTSVAAAIGATARVGFSFIALDTGVVFAPVGALKLLDARAGVALTGGIFELQLGYRARYLDTSATGTLDTLFASTPLAGPGISLGLAL